MTELTLTPEGTFTSDSSSPHVYVPVERMSEHPVLRFALIEGAELTWPGFDHAQRETVSGIHTNEGYIVIPPRINFDLLVDESTENFGTVSVYEDVQRFYTRFTDTQFLHVGTYTAITLREVRRYFLWKPGAWEQITLSQFLYYRDGDETHFAESSREDIEALSPGAVDSEPTRVVTREEFNDMMLDSYFGRDPDDEMYQQRGTTSGTPVPDDVNPTEFVTVNISVIDSNGDPVPGPDAGAQRDDGDDRGECQEGEADLMTEVDAISQHGRASAIASIAHRGQTDKLGYDYIDHPARVAGTFDWLDQPLEHCVAWLHDVIEDSDVTANHLLKAGMLPEIVGAVELLTRRTDVPDEDYYERIRQHPVALAVKLADIDDNLADWRFRKLDYDTQVRLSNKYFRARKLLAGDATETSGAPETGDGPESDEEGE